MVFKTTTGLGSKQISHFARTNFSCWLTELFAEKQSSCQVFGKLHQVSRYIKSSETIQICFKWQYYTITWLLVNNPPLSSVLASLSQADSHRGQVSSVQYGCSGVGLPQNGFYCPHGWEKRGLRAPYLCMWCVYFVLKNVNAGKIAHCSHILSWIFMALGAKGYWGRGRHTNKNGVKFI